MPDGEDVLQSLAAAVIGRTTDEAKALAEDRGVELQVRDEAWVINQDQHRQNRITVDALHGRVTRAVVG